LSARPIVNQRLRTRHDLHGAAVHFSYEVLAMREALDVWKVHRGDVLFRLALENLLLHARNLLNVFHEPRPLGEMGSDDVLARDFFVPPATWERLRPAALPATLGATRDRLNKLLSHLTYSRSEYATNDDPSWRWPCAEMASELEDLIRLFLENLPGEHRNFFAMLQG